MACYLSMLPVIPVRMHVFTCQCYLLFLYVCIYLPVNVTCYSCTYVFTCQCYLLFFYVHVCIYLPSVLGSTSREAQTLAMLEKFKRKLDTVTSLNDQYGEEVEKKDDDVSDALVDEEINGDGWYVQSCDG